MEWSIDHAPIEGRIDATEAILKDSFQRWSLSSPAKPAAFQAKLRRHELAGASLVSTVTGACVEQSPPGHSSFDDEFCLGLQLNLFGRVQLQQWDTPICEGDMFLWRTDQRQDYEVLERTHSVSLMIPWQLMREHLPGRKQPPAACRIDSHTGVGSLLSQHLMGLAKEIGAVPPSAHVALCRTVIGLLDIALPEPESATRFTAMAALRERVLAYIAQHFQEDDLSPARIAAAHGISLRYLHALFAQGDTTVVGHILESRLQACWRTLVDPVCRHLQVSAIAFHWGFNSTSHFCRAFKQRFGVSPSDARGMTAHGSAIGPVESAGLSLAHAKSTCHALAGKTRTG
ncbi:helix-turn-helix domain-containing protein [Delftia tsuruhatensis]|uniref:helix-turn-helix domain-containing protein n=1 Tax=Delftia tsuruhatensis TaxID=180282 RepID=UPI0039BD1A9A